MQEPAKEKSNAIAGNIVTARVALCAPGEDCTILFARNPVPGQVKSRLWTHLTPEQACRLHCASTNDVLALLDGVLPPDTRRWLFLSDQPQTTAGSLRVPERFGCALQENGDLGRRLGAAFRRAFASGARRVVIFGSDSPTLPPETVTDAFQRLAACDLVLGPTEDGGYYLVGCSRFDPALFEGVAWGTPRTCSQTLANAERLAYRTAILQRWFDLDEWKDMERLLASAHHGTPLPHYVAAFLKELQQEKTSTSFDFRNPKP